MTKEQLTKKLTERVRVGIVFLNAVTPKWFKKITLEDLDLASSHTCVLGELYGGYKIGKEKLGFSRETEENRILSDSIMEKLGLYSENMSNYPKLTKIWKEEIKKLQKK